MNPVHSRFGRIGLVAGLVMATLVGVTSLTASGQSTPAPPTVAYGTITIDLFDRSGVVTFDPADAELPTLTQALGVATPCSTLVTSGIVDPGGNAVEGTFLNFTATGGVNPNVQLPSSGIGVTDGANCGGPAGLFGPGETLTLTLGDYFPDSEDGPKVDTATLNIGKSRGPDGSLRVAYDGGALGSSISIANSGQMVDVGGPSVVDFSSITLASTASQSSRGLSVKTSTVFDLVAPLGYDEAVFCNDPPYAETDVDLYRSVSFQRLVNGPKSNGIDCEDVGVTIKFGERTVTWDNGTVGINTGSPQDVRGFVTVEWDGLDLDELDRLDTFINYDGIDTGPFFPVVWCQSWNGLADANGEAERPADTVPLRFAENVDPTGLVDSEGVVTPAALSVPANFELGPVPWCMVSNEENLGDDEVLQTQIYYGGGDPTPFR